MGMAAWLGLVSLLEPSPSRQRPDIDQLTAAAGVEVVVQDGGQVAIAGNQFQPVADAQPVAVAQRRRCGLAQRPRRVVQVHAVGAGVLQPVGATAVADLEVMTGNDALGVRQHPVVVGRATDGAAAGEVFTSPSPQTICEAARAIDRGKGVVFVYGNYSGDTMNFDMAAEFLAAEGIATRTIRVRDDVAVGAPDRPDERRGIAGDVFVIKVAGGAAAELDSLDGVAHAAAPAAA